MTTPSQTSGSVESWSRQYELRRGIARRLGTIFQLPLSKRARDVLVGEVRDGDAILEVGAGDRRMREVIAAARQETTYQSMDIDPHGDHDYNSLTDIPHTYDVVFAFEVVEHISLQQLQEFLPQAVALLKPGGRLILSTPNIYYPPAYLRDITHMTPLCYDELGALVEGAGAEVTSITRIHNDPLHRLVLRRYLLGWLFRTIGIDYARQIVLCARRPQ